MSLFHANCFFILGLSGTWSSEDLSCAEIIFWYRIFAVLSISCSKVSFLLTLLALSDSRIFNVQGQWSDCSEKKYCRIDNQLHNFSTFYWWECDQSVPFHYLVKWKSIACLSVCRTWYSIRSHAIIKSNNSWPFLFVMSW